MPGQKLIPVKYRRSGLKTAFFRYPDQALLFTIIFLLCAGLVVVYSSSSIHSMHNHEDSLFYVRRQFIRMLIGLVLMVFFAFLDYRKLSKAAPFLCLGATIGLLLVYIPGIGVEAGGGRRWIDVFVRIQPSEYFKVFYIVFLGTSLSQLHKVEHKFLKLILPHLAFLGFVFLVVLKQPDLSTAFLIALVGVTLICFVYTKPALILGLVIGGAFVVGYQVYKTPYRLKRVIAFMNPSDHELGYGYQVLQSKISLGSGGVTGLGLGQSRQKFFYLPEEHTDFIFAVVGEEFGFIGTFLLLLAFMSLVLRGLRISRYAPDSIGQLIALGIMIYLTLQILFNLMVVVGLVPPTGLPLPFVSYGGNALITNLISAGILLNISSHCVYP